ncbi:kinase-like protein [Gigaspora margarita]|nr:kinase-like protein [Gigaspora margarita]
MVLEYANNGDLRCYLHEHFSELDWLKKIRMAREISSGINCLHSANIVHRDLHDKNILVHDGSLKITDFGLAKSLENDSSSIDFGIYAFSDPNYLENSKFKREKPSDIYSLSMLFWEISSGIPPFNKMSNPEIVLHVVSKKQRENPVDGTPMDFIKLYCDAWDGDPTKRPTIAEIRNRLDNIKIPVDQIDHNSDHIDSAPIEDFNSIEVRFQNLRVVISEEIHDDSLVDFTKALGIDPNNVWALRNRGETYRIINGYKESLEDFNRLLTIEPNDACAIRNVGEIERIIEENKQSKFIFRRKK